jgi:hypothetical protein
MKRIETFSGSVYHFTDDGKELVLRESKGSTIPDYRNEDVSSFYSEWPPVVGRSMSFTLLTEPTAVITTSLVTEVKDI